MLVGQVTDRKQMAGVVVFSTRAMVMEDMATRKCPGRKGGCALMGERRPAGPCIEDGDWRGWALTKTGFPSLLCKL